MNSAFAHCPTTKRRPLLPTVLLALMLVASTRIGIAAGQPVDLLLPNIALRPGVTVDMHATLFVNEEHRAQGVTLLALHGFTMAGNSWAPFVEALFDDNPAGRKVGQVVVLNMPGRGGTEVVGLPLGEVTLEDYATALLGSLEALNAQKIRPKTILTHSLGSMVVQLAQQSFIGQGSSLRAAFDIKNVVFLGAKAPAAIEEDNSFWWPVVGMAEAFGWTVIPFPLFPEEWRLGGLFTDFSGNLIPGTPSLEEIVEKGYIGAEPFPVLLQVAGYPPFGVPSVSPGIFEPRYRTLLQTVAYEQDFFHHPVVAAQAHAYLTGDTALEHFFVVPGNTAHGLHVADPRYLLESIAGSIVLP